jgi:hypothetical protein
MLKPSRMNRRAFLSTATATAAAAAYPWAAGVASAAEMDPTVLGQGAFRFRRDESWSFRRDGSPVEVRESDHVHDEHRKQSH